MYICKYIHQLIDTWVDSIFLIVNSATINIGVLMSFQHIDLISSEYIPSGEFAGSCGSFNLVF
jgi:hypothetical protein